MLLRGFLIMSPPFFTHSMVALSWLSKCSFVPGLAEIGGTLSLILKQVSGSSAAGGIFFMGGNGHNLQGSPGHKHPVHSAHTSVADIPSNNPRTSGTITRNPPIDRICMAIFLKVLLQFAVSPAICSSSCSKQSSNASSQPHRQCAPERDTHCARRHIRATSMRSHPTQECEKN